VLHEGVSTSDIVTAPSSFIASLVVLETRPVSRAIQCFLFQVFKEIEVKVRLVKKKFYFKLHNGISKNQNGL